LTKAYYNEIDPKAAAWLRQLIKNGLIAYGEVDERSIEDVGPGDLKGFTQHHFFAGIGGWSYALRLAGWPDAKPVWTGSAPCQPFSSAGNNKGKKDDRHLWPYFFRLIRECKPNTLFGEQVTGAIKHGWLDDLQTDMEAEGYAVGHCVFGAHSVNAAHIRQRLYWVADSNSVGCNCRCESPEQATGQYAGIDMRSEDNEWLANSSGAGYQKQSGVTRISCEKDGYESGENSAGSSGMGDTEYEQCERSLSGHREEFSQDSKGSTGEPTRSVQTCWLGNAESERCRETGASVDRSEEWIAGSSIGMGNAKSNYEQWHRQSRESHKQQKQNRGSSVFNEVEWIYCRDNKYRPIKPGIKPLVNGLPRGMVHSSDSSIAPNETQEARVMRLKGYGNAIVPQVAAEFIKAFQVI